MTLPSAVYWKLARTSRNECVPMSAVTSSCTRVWLYLVSARVLMVLRMRSVGTSLLPRGITSAIILSVGVCASRAGPHNEGNDHG